MNQIVYLMFWRNGFYFKSRILQDGFLIKIKGGIKNG